NRYPGKHELVLTEMTISEKGKFLVAKFTVDRSTNAQVRKGEKLTDTIKLTENDQEWQDEMRNNYIRVLLRSLGRRGPNEIMETDMEKAVSAQQPFTGKSVVANVVAATDKKGNAKTDKSGNPYFNVHYSQTINA